MSGCGYHGFDFGARYLDSVCIDGQLFDADSCDDDGNLLEPSEYIACPQCNHESWLADLRDEIEEQGAIAADDGQPRRNNPFRSMKLRFPSDRRRLKRWWNRGYTQGLRDRVT